MLKSILEERKILIVAITSAVVLTLLTVLLATGPHFWHSIPLGIFTAIIIFTVSVDPVWRRGSKNIKFETAEGEVEVSLDSIELFLRQHLESAPDIQHVRLELYVDKKKKNHIICNARVRLKFCANLPSRVMAIQSTLRRHFEEVLPIEHDFSPQIQPIPILEDKTKRKSSRKSKAIEPETFSRPEWPENDTEGGVSL